MTGRTTAKNDGLTFGLLRGQVVVIVHTETEDEIRVISIRAAERDEQLLYFRNL